MKYDFEGLTQARQYAEEVSRKSNGDAFVLKSKAKGILYRVCTSEGEVKAGEKILHRYRAGKLV